MRRAHFVVSVVVVLGVLAGSVQAQVLKFDFGADKSPLGEGFTRVTPRSAFSEAAGFGWKTKLRVVPNAPNWWNPKEKGGIIAGYDSAKGAASGSDYVFGYHFFGWKHDSTKDRRGVNRLGIKMDDDLETDFVVKVKPGKYSLLIAMGDIDVVHRLRPWTVEVNGERISHEGFSTLTPKQKSNIDCPDGRLTVTFRADTGYKSLYPWNQCTWWMVNYMIVAPVDQEKEIDETLAELQTGRFEMLKKQYIPRGGPAQKFEIRDGHIAKNGKPFLRLLYHGWGWSDVLKFYRLYAWTNTINLGGGWMSKFFNYGDVFRDGWRKRAATGAFPTDWFTEANHAYKYNYLVNYYPSKKMFQYLPPGYRKTHPDATGVFANGKRDAYNRYLGEPGGDVFTRRTATVLADLVKLHPTSCSIEIFEEYWITGTGFHPKELAAYRNWLAKKYGTVAKLNAEWGATYANFTDIIPPAKWEASGNYVNHNLWKGEMSVRIAKISYDGIKKADPYRIVAGGKGQFGIASWYYAPPTDIFGWYGTSNMDVARAASEHFGKILEPVHVNLCQHQTMRGGRPVSTYPFMNYRHAAYSLMLTQIIDGAKSIFNEDYGTSHDFHYFHRTKFLRGKKLEGTLGGVVKLDRDDYPDVYLEAKSLELGRVNQLLLRLAPIFLPTKISRAKVALLATTESSFSSGPNPFYSNQVRLPSEIFKRLQIPYDVLRRPILDRMEQYDVLVLTSLAGAVRPDTVDKIKRFVRRGGKLLILPPTAHQDARTLKPYDFRLEEIAGCRVGGGTDCGGNLKITVTKNDLIRSLKAGDRLPGFSGLRRGKLRSLAVTDGKVLAEVGGKPVAAVSKDGRVVTISLARAVPSWRSLGAERFDRNMVRFFSDVFAQWKVTRPVALAGTGETHMIDVGVLDGKNTWLVLLASYSRAGQTVNAKLNFLPPGRYDVIDVTGERPLVRKDANGQNYCAPDPKYRRSFFAAKDKSSRELKQQGVTLDVGAVMGRVLLIRPAGEKVWVNCPDYELKALSKDRVIIVTGTTPASRNAAMTVWRALGKLGTKAEIAAPNAIRTRTVKNEIVIDDFKVASFSSTPLDVDTHLILIGNETDNPVIKHISADGTYCFDKVLQKVDAAFPGPGRGFIEVVESVSNEAYDWTARSRDAIVIAGSDARGIKLAADRFAEIVTKK